MPRESLKDKTARAKKIVALLKKRYPDAKTSLDYDTVHQLMVATILSAQCTDERVNMTTPALFERFRSVKDFAEADSDELESLIQSCGFFRAKAKSIKSSARVLLERFGGEMPRTIDELTTLPGVGRKTASVVLGAGFGIAEGIVVDTHVARISKLLGLTAHTDPLKIEQDLMKVLEPEDWIRFSHMLIYHGRAVCIARRPKCAECVLAETCPSAKM
ncbi:MAG: endonuclease III [candidate division Zixibacteria bacterium]|jgi:endonuclease-3|nr:endonuclease III [candidate division Zixibacteria bacterium]